MEKMTVAEFAHKMKVNRSTIYRMVLWGKLPKGAKASTHLSRLEIHLSKDFQWPKK